VSRVCPTSLFNSYFHPNRPKVLVRRNGFISSHAICKLGRFCTNNHTHNSCAVLNTTTVTGSHIYPFFVQREGKSRKNLTSRGCSFRETLPSIACTTVPMDFVTLRVLQTRFVVPKASSVAVML
jgi:hypothetical protein